MQLMLGAKAEADQWGNCRGDSSHRKTTTAIQDSEDWIMSCEILRLKASKI